MFFRNKLRELERANAAMRSALAWYAREENWRRSGVNEPGADRQWVKAPAARDRGALAARVLKFVQGDSPNAARRRTWWRLPSLRRRGGIPDFLLAPDKRR